jgi:hypothetical protein
MNDVRDFCFSEPQFVGFIYSFGFLCNSLEVKNLLVKFYVWFEYRG